MKGVRKIGRRILVADRDPVYVQALAQRIQKHCPASDVSIASDELSYQTQLASAGSELSLIVSAAQFPVGDLPSGVSQLILLESPIEANADHADDKLLAPPLRLGSVQPILKRLDLVKNKDNGAQSPDLSNHQLEPEYVDRQEVARQADFAHAGAAGVRENLPLNEYPSGSADDSQSKLKNAGRIILMFTQTTNGRLAEYTDWRCAELSKTGSTVYYLALLPNILCRQAPLTGPQTGSGLSDLLLRISGGGLSVSELGSYMAIDRQGRLQIRPSDRADDLLDCRPQDLFQLVVLLRERVLASEDNLLVVEAACVSFRAVQAIVPLFDVVEIIMPDESDFAGKALLREIGELLPELSASAKLKQINELSFKEQRIKALRTARNATV